MCVFRDGCDRRTIGFSGKNADRGIDYLHFAGELAGRDSQPLAAEKGYLAGVTLWVLGIQTQRQACRVCTVPIDRQVCVYVTSSETSSGPTPTFVLRVLFWKQAEKAGRAVRRTGGRAGGGCP